MPIKPPANLPAWGQPPLPFHLINYNKFGSKKRRVMKASHKSKWVQHLASWQWEKREFVFWEKPSYCNPLETKCDTSDDEMFGPFVPLTRSLIVKPIGQGETSNMELAALVRNQHDEEGGEMINGRQYNSQTVLTFLRKFCIEDSVEFLGYKYYFDYKLPGQDNPYIFDVLKDREEEEGRDPIRLFAPGSVRIVKGEYELA